MSCLYGKWVYFARDLIEECQKVQAVTENVTKILAQRRKDAKETAGSLKGLTFAALRLCVKYLAMLVEQDGDVAPHVRLMQRRVSERLPDRGSVVRFGE